MSDVKSHLKTAVITLAVIWVLNQTPARPLVYKALSGS